MDKPNYEKKNKVEIDVLEFLLQCAKSKKIDMFEQHCHVTRETGKYPVYTIKIQFNPDEEEEEDV